MRTFFILAIAAVCLALSFGSAAAQDQNFIFAEYYICDQNRETMADVLAEHVLGPVIQQQVEAGRLTGWGWLAHRIGGEWRRLLFSTGNDIGKMLEAREAVINTLQNNHGSEYRAFVEICGSHDDVIWNRVAGPDLAEVVNNLGDFSYSTYYFCDQARQDRVDEIVKELLAPAINQLMESGELKSWGWYAHAFGGVHRRLMTHSGMDQAGLIAAIFNYNNAAGEANEAMAKEFTEICRAHVDYMWNRVLPKQDGN